MHAESDLYDALDELLLEYDGTLPAGTVVRRFTLAVRQLRAAGVDAGLDVAAQAMTRHSLRLHVPQQVPA